MSSLKILISHTSIFKNAGWGRVFPLAEGLVKQGHQVTILTTNPEYSLFIKKHIINNVSIIIYPELIPSRVSRMGFGFLSLFLKIIHVLFNRYDVVQSDNGHRPLAGIPCRLNKRIFNSIYVAEWYDWYGRGGQYDTKKKLFKLLLGWYELKYEIKDKKVADGIVVLSEILRERAQKFKQSDRIIKVHGGADISNIPFLANNSDIKTKYNIDKDTLTLGYITSNSYNLAEFTPLINAIVSNNITHKVKILVFGESNSIASQLTPKTKNLFIFIGWVDFQRDFEKLQCVDSFFLFKEDSLGNKAGWPNCIGDYLACGRPVLLNPVGEVVDFSNKHPYAFLETTRDSDSIFEKISFLLNNRDETQRVGAKIRDLAVNVVSWEAKSKELVAFYEYLSLTKNK